MTANGPYREGALACPACRDVLLRRHGNRLVCDRCTGLMLAADDLSRSLSEPIGNAPVTAALRDATEGRRACPHCGRAMMTGHLDLSSPMHGKRIELDSQIDRCPAHGFWFDSGELMQALTAIYDLSADRHQPRSWRVRRL